MALIKENIGLAPFTTLGVGGAARFFARADSVECLKQVNSFAKSKGLPFIVLGGGSNILVSDSGVDGVVVKMNTKGIKWTKEDDHGDVFMEVSAGEVWDDVVEESTRRGFYGIENLSGIPGTAGASPVQNIGAYGVEVSEAVSCVTAYDTEKEEMITFSKEECQFGYRESIFKKNHGRFIVTSLTLCLSRFGEPVCSYKDIAEKMSNTEEKPDPQTMRQIVLDIRDKKFPDMDLYGSAGSFFKNPVVSGSKLKELKQDYPNIPFYSFDSGHSKVPLAWILDKVLGLRGKSEGNVGLFEGQPLVLITYKNANASEVVSFAERVRNKVLETTGLEVEYEVVIL
ncbi:MAG: UDP-N-acetylmuramate dehydrogenase [Patescibacteria group bacterium]